METIPDLSDHKTGILSIRPSFLLRLAIDFLPSYVLFHCFKEPIVQDFPYRKREKQHSGDSGVVIRRGGLRSRLPEIVSWLSLLAVCLWMSYSNSLCLSFVHLLKEIVTILTTGSA